MRVFNNLPGQSNIFIVWEMRAIDHHRRETIIDTGLADLERIAMIEMQADRDVRTQLPGHLHGTHGHVTQHGGVGIFTGPLADLDNHRRITFGAGGNDRLELLKIIKIVGRNGVATINGFGKHIAGVDQPEIGIMDCCAHQTCSSPLWMFQR